MRSTYLTGVISLFIVVLVQSPGYGAENALAPKAVRRMADVLSDRRLAPPEETAGGIRTRGPSLRDLYRSTVQAVPIVVAEDGTGSSVVVNVNPADRSALVVTNHHVVENPFQTEEGEPFVLLLFHTSCRYPGDRSRSGSSASVRDECSTWCDTDPRGAPGHCGAWGRRGRDRPPEGLLVELDPRDCECRSHQVSHGRF